MNQLRVAVFCDYYLPGFRAGGPTVSVSRIVEAEKGHEVRVISRDRDLGERSPYVQAETQSWVALEDARVGFLGRGVVRRTRDWIWVMRELRRWKPNVIYINSLQSAEFSLLPLSLWRFGVIDSDRLLLAPRGECSPGARSLKRTKKRIARPFIRRLLSRPVTWHASSVRELQDIGSWWGKPIPSTHRIVVRANPAPPPRSVPSAGSSSPRPVLVFASRIDRMKGLDQLLSVLMSVDRALRLDIHGTVQDDSYWKECCAWVERLPAQIEVRYCGPYVPRQATAIFEGADLLVLPTRGENFGQVIAEALSVGCPVAISDQTMWSDVVTAAGGWICSNDQDYRQAVVELVDNDRAKRAQLRAECLRAYRAWHVGERERGSLFESVGFPADEFRQS